MRIKYLITILGLLVAGLLPSPAQAGGVVTVCDEAHLLAALAGGGTVTFACSGTIILTTTIDVSSNTTVDGSGQSVTLSGNNAVRVFWVNSGVMLNLNKITVVGGYAGSGAGIYNDGGMVTVSNSTFAGNFAYDGAGGGIANVGGTLIVSNSIFSDNSTLGVGGGIYNHGPLTVSDSSFSGNESDFGGGIFSRESELTVSNSTFSSNFATGYYGRGGGIRSYLGMLNVSNSTFAGNGAISDGGGIFSYGTLTVTNSLFSDNRVMMGSGGGIVNENGTATVSNSIFSGNSVTAGGGISNFDGGTLSVSDSTFSGNSATMCGGGINNQGALAVSNSTFSNNNASFDWNYSGGGGINNRSGTATVTNSSFFGNETPYDRGGAIRNNGLMTLKNTIVANSPAGNNCFGSIIDGGGNLSYPDTTCPGINADPLLGPLQDNGGPTWTMELGPGSAAIDAGDDATCAADPVNNLDQRGVFRPQGAHCDSGALEQLRTWLPIILAQ